MTNSTPNAPCPDCGRPLTAPAASAAHCPHCGLPVTGPVFGRVRWVEGELHRLDHQRGTLLAERRRLLGELRAGAVRATANGPQSDGPPGFGPPAYGPSGFGPPPAGFGPPRHGAVPPPRPGRETSPGTARNVLLALGGVLLTVAALAFTLFSWGEMGIAGRAAVLATVTLAAVAAPVLLLRRTLNATAEAVGWVALVLLLLDAYALRQVRLQHTDALAYTATAVAVVAGLWAVYGTLVPRPGLRGPVPAAVVLAQLPVPLGAGAAGAGLHGTAWALLVTAAADTVLAVAPWTGARRPSQAVRVTASVTALLTGIPALLLAGWLSLAAQDPASALEAGALLLAAAAVLLSAGWRRRTYAVALGCAAGLLAVAATGGLVRTLVPSVTWVAPGYLLCAVLLVAAVSGVRKRGKTGAVTEPKRSPRAGLLLAAAGVHACALLYAAPPLAYALFAPLGWAESPWRGVPRDAGAFGAHWTGDAGTVVILGVCASVLAVAGRMPVPVPVPDGVRRAAALGALVLGAAAVAVAPTALDLPYAAVRLVLVALVVALLGLAATGTGGRLSAATASGVAVVTALTALGWALTDRTATLVTLPVLSAAFAAAAVLAARRHTTRPPRDGAFVPPGGAVSPTAGARYGGGFVTEVAVAALCAAVAVLHAAGFAWAVPVALDVPHERAAFAVFAVAAVAAWVAARLARPTTGTGTGSAVPPRFLAPGAVVSLAVEGAGYVVAGWSLLPAAADAPLLALALALCGVLAGCVAVREDRRPAAYVATALFLLATWVRLYASDVEVPEAYTLPPAVAALAMGLLRLRAQPRLSSWAAYAPALTLALLPSLVALLGDPHGLRPLLLGIGALAVTLLGARHRLQAPLLLGGAALALVAAHELAPYLAHAVGLLPRWLPPAVAGLLLLAVGATYEQRLRDARRLHAAWRRLG
ncbi:hypothetical protein RM572_26810 [Streptomyces sp. DSM 42041]|uniref:Integral membrane protein n=1 Tax=Streptomyces hazeniae TaxID=3075538 RepID=A0ABU2NZG3_9ACTN|nr:hypothetical protein [Streptomyces sp. DSM 42041]MDT0382376.1 hypothetical protein [Streptomyces sp. DSM 42041]